LPTQSYFEVIKNIKNDLIEIARKQNASFIRINSTTKNKKENKA